MRDRGITFDAAMLPCGRAVTDLRSLNERKPHGYWGKGKVRGVEGHNDDGWDPALHRLTTDGTRVF